METMPRPRNFFGTALAGIRTPADARTALSNFCCEATYDEIYVARKELRSLAKYQPEIYDAINTILWSLKFHMDSRAWSNRYLLLNAGL